MSFPFYLIHGQDTTEDNDKTTKKFKLLMDIPRGNGDVEKTEFEFNIIIAR